MFEAYYDRIHIQIKNENYSDQNFDFSKLFKVML